MTIIVRATDPVEIAPLREAFRREMDCQIVHDSIHARPGWTLEYLVADGDTAVGYGSVAIAGPWRNRPTAYEFYLVPERRERAFEVFESFLAVSSPQGFETQTNDTLCTVLCLTYAREFSSEAVVFRDDITTAHVPNGVTLRSLTPAADIQTAIAGRQGGGEWVAEVDGAVVGSGGVLFHYNRPYGDVYMDVNEPFRRRGIGCFLVQELKRMCYELGAIPGARCSTSNTASRRTLQKAGFVPVAHILVGSFGTPSLPRV